MIGCRGVNPASHHAECGVETGEDEQPVQDAADGAWFFAPRRGHLVGFAPNQRPVVLEKGERQVHGLMDHALGEAERSDFVVAVRHGDEDAVGPAWFAVAHVVARRRFEQMDFIRNASNEIAEVTAPFD